MGKLRKVVLTRREVVRCVVAFDGVELPQRSGTSHVRYRCEFAGQIRLVTIDDSIDEFRPDAHSPLFYIVRRQLQVSWEDFYAAHPDVARRAGVDYRRPG